MIKFQPKAAGLAAAATLLALPCMLAVPRAAHGGGAPPFAAAPLPYRVDSLPNGLKVITLEDHHAPVVTLQVWYRVGSKDEAPGKAGFAHLFEHLMFKGSQHIRPEEHAKLIEQLGGDNNANTSYDRTMYYETVASNALDRVLYMEADRMRSLNVDEANLKSERSVVEEEYRLRVANAPYGMLTQRIGEMLYPPDHPYHHTPIGLMQDLDAAKLSDVRSFHAMYYRPDNAFIVLVGDFKTADALNRIRHWFGSIPHSTAPFRRYPAISSNQTAPAHAVFTDPLARLPMVGMAFRLPPPADKDTVVFDVISQILSTGESSRMYRTLVRDRQIAVEAGGENDPLRLGGFFFFYAVASPGTKPEALEEALKDQVHLLQSSPVTADELMRAKNQSLTAHVFGTLSTLDKANLIGETDILYDSPRRVNTELQEIAAVTAADIRRVAGKYFALNVSSTFDFMPSQGETKPAEKQP